MAISSLSEEIQVEIFMKLPANSILICRCVCKIWYTLLSEPLFIKDHLNNQASKNPRLILNNTRLYIYSNSQAIVYSIDYASLMSSSSSPLSSVSTALSLSMEADDACVCIGARKMDYPFEYKKISSFKILGSCNGLICVSTCGRSGELLDNNICIWNPTTRQYKDVSLPRYDLFVKEHNLIRYGFGHDRDMDDYKVVRISGYKQEPDCYRMQVYTLGTDSWNCMNDRLSHSFHKFALGSMCGLFFHGALHWMAGKSYKDEVIVSVDVSSERLVEVPFPRVTMIPTEYAKRSEIHVGELGDCLCLAVAVSRIRFDVWVMQEYGVGESWTKQFTIDEDQVSISGLTFFKPIWSFEHGEILINKQNDLVLYDQISGRVRKVYFPYTNITGDLSILPENIERYVESLVPIKSGTYVEKKTNDLNLENFS